MPYSGVEPGSETEKKIERCVEKVMREQGKDKSAAIAICRASIEKKDAEMSEEIEVIEEELPEVEESKSVQADLELAVADHEKQMSEKEDGIINFFKKKLGFSKETFSNSLVVIKNNGEKQDDYPYRWVGIVSNNFQDREGEILSEGAHKEFIEHLNTEVFGTEKAILAPDFRSWHMKGTERESLVDAAEYMNGFVVVSGPLNEKEAEGLMRAAKDNELGMSHGFIALKRDPNNTNIITKYRSYEVSDLPLSRAANAWTNLSSFSIKEAGTMTDQKLEYLKTVVGAEKYAALMEDTETKQAILEAVGVPSKELEEETEPAEEAKSVEIDVDAFVEQVKEQLGLVKLSETLENQEATIKALSAVVTKQDETIKALQGEAEEKVADLIEAPAEKKKDLMWMRDSARKATELKEGNADDDELKSKAVGNEGWFSQATHSSALPEPTPAGDALDALAA